MTPIAVVIFAILALTGLPIAIGSGIAGVIAVASSGRFPLAIVIQRMIFSIDNFVLLAIPLFILCGRLMNVAGITDRIFGLAQKLVGHVAGGLAHANVVASMIFAGMSGAAVADAGGLGQVEIKAMKDQGYELDFAVSITAASATIGPIIPPSIPMILYASIAEESIGRLFLGGFIPGVLIGIMLMGLIYFISRKRNYSRSKRGSISEIWIAFKRAFLPLLTPVIIVGGIFSGIFTVTEAAAVAALYTFILGGLIYKEIKLSDIPGILIETMKTTAVMMFILSTIAAISWMMVYEKVTDHFATFIVSLTENPWIILGMINIFLLLLGTVLEGAPIMILTIPLFAPLIQSVGGDPVHFGVVMVLNIAIGTITPPIGMLLFIVTQVSGLPLEKLMKAIIPFVIPLLVVLALITYVPKLVMFLPNLIMP
jgi:tripartite ATP-independent transporter DctM subunit